uniref:(California timema) hypothetical protein n=1 Tax=Timema californicum TaxID=61474 RepID=A0A7R9J1J3_TIMCA|nr:unnamed protein product [Timema californicum]
MLPPSGMMSHADHRTGGRVIHMDHHRRDIPQPRLRPTLYPADACPTEVTLLQAGPMTCYFPRVLKRYFVQSVHSTLHLAILPVLLRRTLQCDIQAHRHPGRPVQAVSRVCPVRCPIAHFHTSFTSRSRLTGPLAPSLQMRKGMSAYGMTRLPFKAHFILVYSSRVPGEVLRKNQAHLSTLTSVRYEVVQAGTWPVCHYHRSVECPPARVRKVIQFCVHVCAAGDCPR